MAKRSEREASEPFAWKSFARCIAICVIAHGILKLMRYLWFLILSYTMVLTLANWFDARIVDLFGIITDAGTIIFPLSFVLSDMITEVYGYKHARRAIWCGFLFNMIFLGYGQLVIHLPNPPFHTYNALFTKLLGLNTRIIIASIISYFIAEPLNAYIVAKLKIKMQGRKMWLRFVSSTVIASFFDSTIFTVIAFIGLFSTHAMFILAANMWLIKVIVEIIGLPFSTWLARKLKKAEGIDQYDTDTKFKLFSLDTSYTTARDRIVPGPPPRSADP